MPSLYSVATLAEQGVGAVGKDPSNVTVAGTMVYTPALSTTPDKNAGSMTVQYDFTPTNMALYLPSSLTRSYTINPPDDEQLSGNGIVAAADGSGPATINNCTFFPGEPNEFTLASVSCAGPDVITGSATLDAGFIGQPAGVVYSYEDEVWYYSFQPS